MSSSLIQKAELLNALHVSGTPLIVTNVWDAITATTVAQTPGVKALASASHSVSNVRGLQDGEGLTVDEAIIAARIITSAVDLPVSIDFEKGYAADAAGVSRNVRRLIEEGGAAGINIEDSVGAAKSPQFDIGTAAARVAAAREGAEAAGVPLVINARVDTLAGGGEWTEAVARANAYLDAGADVIFFLGLTDEDKVKRALDEVNGRISVIGVPGLVPLKRLAELGVSRVSFGPGTLGVALAALQSAATTLTGLGDYPEDLGFKFKL
ncbi:isocitrate lyase/phosphoenolpyruvate mutase family protein [Cryobacterium sinapicolor]|uniref:Isocitrate lyase/phosphoenolpyruvate mutase family protein n=1 Tax=Cryobacterium sinapicolor TaxID=1259236 RepID=A0ABY2IXB5_9MICO|nr:MULTISPECIES: isocitrate lyase/phosphoenolpyruvate mutase family protein [Cryobacterium]TFC84270.1 isocitrate lyase/phosphoenolpyruvate mutase family protein [Cryobacterium sp. TMT3-29-2]TFC95073.1 isocitrate lyase/phosphoenolpyruvate mutase family protein [Cryobacterium sinapicolor]